MYGIYSSLLLCVYWNQGLHLSCAFRTSWLAHQKIQYIFMWRYLDLQMKSVNKAAFVCRRRQISEAAVLENERASIFSRDGCYHCFRCTRWKQRQTQMEAGGCDHSGWRPFIPGKTTRPDQRMRDAFSPVLMLIMERSFATQCRPHFPSGQGILNVCKWVSLQSIKASLIVSDS